MSIWILAIVLLVVFAAIGFAKGAIRMSISFIGILLGILLARPMGGLMTPLMGPLGIKNPVWLFLMPPVIAFVLIYIIVFALSFFVHHKVYLFYKYKRDDADRIRWERMNRFVGASAGIVTGAVFFFLVTGLIYSAGYLTVQLSAEENNPPSIKFINSVRQDMSDVGFDRAAARFAPASEFYYESADVFGLLYHNPLLQNRLAIYPYFITLGQRPEFQEILTDKEYNDLIFGKAPITKIIDHPRTQALLGNREVMEYLRGTDIPDLKQFLRTGKSDKYEDQDILGVWTLDENAVLHTMRKSNPEIRTRDLRMVKQAFELMPPVVLMAAPDNKVIMKIAGDVAPPAEEQPPVDPMMERYRQMAPQQQAQAPAPAQPTFKIPQFSGEGTWKEQTGAYVITMAGPDGNEVSLPATVKGDELFLSAPNITLVFAKE